tara:strand:+ start:2517 stop:3509 length:993 start_codon:yes stop_codon:yes gene_type:complete
MSQVQHCARWLHLTVPQPSRAAWAVLAIVTVIDVIWSVQAGFTIVSGSVSNLMLGAFASAMMLGFILYGRGRKDLEGLVAWASTALFAIPFSIAVVVLSYLAASVSMPLVDDQLASFDQALGFDWVGLLQFVNTHAFFGQLTSAIYGTAFPELALLFLFLAFTNQTKQLRELVDVYWSTLLLTVALSALFPAVGPYAYYAPSHDMMPVVQPTAGMVFLPDYLALRAGTYHAFDFGQMQGIIEFPSFHAALIVMMTWSMRRSPYLLAVGGIYNGLMMLATLTEGGHYLADVVVGCLLVAMTIAARHGLIRWYASRLRNPIAAAPSTGALQA